MGEKTFETVVKRYFHMATELKKQLLLLVMEKNKDISISMQTMKSHPLSPGVGPGKPIAAPLGSDVSASIAQVF